MDRVVVQRPSSIDRLPRREDWRYTNANVGGYGQLLCTILRTEPAILAFWRADSSDRPRDGSSNDIGRIARVARTTRGASSHACLKHNAKRAERTPPASPADGGATLS